MTPDISFIVPTLNRGRYVVRAVETCLRSIGGADVVGQVVVLDSESDDGSWEALKARFAEDNRVVLAQNKRGLGPTHSWLDGAALANGRTVTFVWSDDFVAEAFVRTLLPLVGTGAECAVGAGIVRHVDEEEAWPFEGRVERFAPAQLLEDYYGVARLPTGPLAVSPACALFSRAAFDEWLRLVTIVSQGDLLRQQIMWRRAIGPDLLLFLVALDRSTAPVAVVPEPVVQFSEHPGSITVSSSAWPLKTGYWLARRWLLDQPEQATAPRVARMALQALQLAATVPTGIKGLEDRSVVRRGLLGEAGSLARRLPTSIGSVGALRALATAALSRP